MESDYRYTLTRSWDSGKGVVCWVCLNPSNKPDHVDSPTRKAIIHFSQKEGYEELILVNLYAAVTPYGRLLYRHPAPRGPENDWFVEMAMMSAEDVVFAWGGFSFYKTVEPPTDVEHIAQGHGIHPLCLGRTLSGAPRHPLYAHKRSILQPYWGGGFPQVSNRSPDGD